MEKVRFTSVADLSLRYTTILAVTIVVCLGLVALSVVPGDLSGNEGLVAILLLLTSIVVPIGAAIFMIWKWLDFARIGKAFHKDNLGFSKFKHLKRCFVVAVALTFLLFAIHAGDIRIIASLQMAIAGTLLVFDSFVMMALFVFVPLAWHIGCKIPGRVYLEVVVMAMMFCLQVVAVFW
jgi:hypothetical protein